MMATVLVVFVGCTAWTIYYSFTNSKLFPNFNFVGLKQYYDLWKEPRWLVSAMNIWIFGFASIICNMATTETMVVGSRLAATTQAFSLSV